jgi:hypothetical protein
MNYKYNNSKKKCAHHIGKISSRIDSHVIRETTL